MTLDEILHGLFPSGHSVETSKDGWITGNGNRRSGEPIAVIGVANGVPLDAAGVLQLGAHVLGVVETGGDTPILVLVDTQGQLMARRQEMIGLNEYLAHLTKCLLLASQQGHRTIGLEYGRASAGAFLATALATDSLVCLPGAEPVVMDLPSMARVTKLPEDRLKELAKTTPVFAPGLDQLAQTSATAPNARADRWRRRSPSGSSPRRPARPTMLRRHDLLRAGAAAWDARLRTRPDLAEVPLLADWGRLGRPVVVRRRLPGDALDDVPAALSLPPSHGKRRVALDFPRGVALAALPSVRLRDAAADAPDGWQAIIASLVTLGEDTGVEPCVFGAVLWQHVTGLSYLTARSDLDLLWPVADELTAERLVRALTRLDAAGPVRLDGELVLPDGAGVSWREFARAEGTAATVLAKTMDGVAVRRKAGLFAEPVPA